MGPRRQRGLVLLDLCLEQRRQLCLTARLLCQHLQQRMCHLAVWPLRCISFDTFNNSFTLRVLSFTIRVLSVLRLAPHLGSSHGSCPVDGRHLAHAVNVGGRWHVRC
jgi:hypothetical protein